MDNTRRINDDDLSEIISWYDKRGMAIIPELLSNVGFIVPGIAAGYLMGTDTRACILEPFIANPEASEAERDSALHSILAALTEKAEAMGFYYIFGFAASQSMIRRALEQGFYCSEQNTTVIKELRS